MKWTKVTDHLYTTDTGHTVRKVGAIYNVFLADRFIGSGDKEQALKLMAIKQPEQQSAEEWLEDYVSRDISLTVKT